MKNNWIDTSGRYNQDIVMKFGIEKTCHKKRKTTNNKKNITAKSRKN